MRKTSYKQPLFILICLSTLAGFSSCRLYLRVAFGVRNPDIEDHKSLVRKTAKSGLDTANIAKMNMARSSAKHWV